MGKKKSAATQKDIRSAWFSPGGLWRILFLLIVIFSVFSLWREYEKRVWKSGERFTIAVAGRPTVVVSVNAFTGKIAVLSIPNDVYITKPNESGEYRIGSLWYLEHQDNKKDFFVSSLQEFLGIPIQARLGKGSAGGLIEMPKTLAGVIRYKRELIWWNPFFQSNLSFFDYFKIGWLLQKAKPYDVEYASLEKAGGLSMVEFPDGTHGYRAKTAAIDDIVHTFFAEETIKSENVPVAIYNVSGRDGLGSFVGRMLTNIGANVTLVRNDQPLQAGCLLKIPKGYESSALVARLKSLYNCTASDAAAGVVELYLGEELSKTL